MIHRSRCLASRSIVAVRCVGGHLGRTYCGSHHDGLTLWSGRLRYSRSTTWVGMKVQGHQGRLQFNAAEPIYKGLFSFSSFSLIISLQVSTFSPFNDNTMAPTMKYIAAVALLMSSISAIPLVRQTRLPHHSYPVYGRLRQ